MGVRQTINGRCACGLGAAVIAACCGHAVAIDTSTGPSGSNIQAVRNAATRNANEDRNMGWNLSGLNRGVGQIEGGRPGDADLGTFSISLPPNFISELHHPAVNPGGAGQIGVAIGGTTALQLISANSFLDGHATQVAGMMAGRNLGGSSWGAAPDSTIWSSTLSTGVAPGAGTVGQRVVAGGEWLRSRPGGVAAVNHSYGLGRAASLTGAGNNGLLDGNHLQTLYMDWSAVHHNVVHVVAGDESLFRNNSTWVAPSPQSRDELGTDAYNSIVVGSTGQRSAMGRYDQISNFSNSNRTEDARQWRTDLVAPGGASVTVRLRPRDDTGTPATNPNFGLFNGPARTVNVFPANNAVNEDFDTSAPNVFGTIGTGDPTMPTLLDNNQDGALNQTTVAGQPNDSHGMQSAGGTSFAAPQVTGMVSLMSELRPGMNSRTVKAALLNSASKHVLSKDADTNGDDVADTAGRSWTQRYEDRNANPQWMTQVRDPDIGFGQLNGVSAVKQIANGGGSSAVSIQSGQTAAGGDSTFNLFVGGETLKPGSLVTATLTWDRIVNATVANPTTADLQNPSNYTVPGANNLGTASPIADLDLLLVNRQTGATVAASRTNNDNVEHVYFNVRDEGHYDLVVRNYSNQNTSFGLAFSAGTSDGLAFTVERDSQGRQSPIGAPNDVNALGLGGQAGFDLGAEVFTSSLNGSNMQRISGGNGTKSRVGPHLAVPAAENLLDGSRGAMGLVSGDQITGLSFGRDGSVAGGVSLPSTITFSVDHAAVGTGGPGVSLEAAQGSAAGDIFRSAALSPFGVHTSAILTPAPQNDNRTYIQESHMGLWAPNSGVQSIIPNAMADNLRDFEHDNIRDYTDTDGDGMINNSAYFTLSRFSTSVLAGAASPGDILICSNQDAAPGFGTAAPAGGFSFSVFAPFFTIGLQPGDGLDGLILSRAIVATNPDGSPAEPPPFYLPGLDQALFSLDPFSPSVLGGGALPGAIYYTDFARPFNPFLPWELGGSLFALPTDFGLGMGDNIDGLDIWAIPSPSGVTVLAFAGLLCARRRRS